MIYMHTTYLLRFSQEEKDLWTAWADATGLSLAAFIRAKVNAGGRITPAETMAQTLLATKAASTLCQRCARIGTATCAACRKA